MSGQSALAPKVWPRNDIGRLCSHFVGQAGGGATVNFKGRAGECNAPSMHKEPWRRNQG